VKELFVKNIVVAGIKFPSFGKKTGKLQFNSDTFKQFKQNQPRIEIRAIVYFQLHQF